MPQALAIGVVVGLVIAFLITVHRYGYWKARTIGFGVVAILFGGYFLVLAVGQLV